MDTQNFTEDNTDVKPKKSHFKFKLVLVSWALVVMGWILVFGFFSALNNNSGNLFGKLPSLKDLENPNTQIATELYSADSVLLGKYFNKNRTNVPFKDISPNVTNALIATEDVRFYQHSGIDIKGIASIPFYLLKGDRRGASTITQQLARNLYSSSSEEMDGSLTKGKLRALFVKMKEWFTALSIEKAYTKQEIITMYLNTVDFGANTFGIKVASETYFSKDQSKLEPQEAAVLVGLLKATSYYNPKLNPENALRRRNTVLNQMMKYDKLDKTKGDSLKSTPIVLDFEVANHTNGMATYFREETKKFLKEWCKANGYDIYRDGLIVYSTLDSKLQQYAEEAMEEHLTEHQAKFWAHWEGKNPWTLRDEQTNQYKEIEGFLEHHIKRTYNYRVYKKQYKGNETKIEAALNRKRKMTIFTWAGEKDTTFNDYDSLKYYKHFLHTGFMSMDPTTGYIKAWVGGINYKYFKYDHVQQGKRQPGSTFKPIVYATILGEIGKSYGPCFKVIDAPVTFETSDPLHPVWSPNNSDGVFTGDTLTLRQALARSKNSITAYMMKILGAQTPTKVMEYAARLGINTDKMEPVPAMCLGTFDASLYEMVGAYSTFMNKGVHNEPQYIQAIYDKHGNLLHEFKPISNIALSEELAYVMSYMLRGGTQERGGTGLGLHRYGILDNNQIGTKTGTTQDYSDGWFMGITPQLVSGCWVGCEDRTVHFRNFAYGQGARMAMPIFGKFMQKVYADESTGIKRQAFWTPSKEQEDSYSIVTNCSKFTEVKTDEELFKSNTIDDLKFRNEDQDDLAF